MPGPAWKLIVVEGPDPGLERLLAERAVSIGHRVVDGDQVQIGSSVLRFVSSATDVLPPSAPS